MLEQSATNSEEFEEAMTGCGGVGGYRQFARERGYERVEVLDWTSSAGDWSFLVSKDGLEWHPMFQENNWPRGGFTVSIDGETTYFGTFEEVCEEITAIYA